MKDRIRLLLRFDPAAMQRDLLALSESDWIDHFVPQNYEGSWQALPFRAPAGALNSIQTIYSDPNCKTFEDTPLLSRCPYFQEVLAAFECPLYAVRLMKLTPGSVIKAHGDNDLSAENETVRLHVPVTTNDGVDFRLNGERVVLKEGECWYLRLSDSHSVANRGDADRVHLVLDAEVTPWLQQQLQDAEALHEIDEGIRSAYPTETEGSLATDPDFTGWAPFRIRAHESGYRVDWCFLGRERFTDPFFEDTIRRCLRKPFNQFVAPEPPVETLIDWAASHPGISPTAFIFHSSRCGSTLLAQMAAALPCNIVISEAPPIDHIIRARLPEETRRQFLRALISVLGRSRDAEERHLFVKFDAWHILDLELIQRAFPGTPCLFLYREPSAVVASQQRMPGSHILPGALDPASLGLDPAAVEQLERDEYAGRVLGAFYAAAATHAAAGRISLMNYASLPAGGVLKILEWCELTDSNETRERLIDVAQFDAKTPALFFDPSDISTRPLPTQRARDIAERFIDPFYAQLESMRLA
jgi:hypothetical protein